MCLVLVVHKSNRTNDCRIAPGTRPTILSSSAGGAGRGGGGAANIQLVRTVLSQAQQAASRGQGGAGKQTVMDDGESTSLSGQVTSNFHQPNKIHRSLQKIVLFETCLTHFQITQQKINKISKFVIAERSPDCSTFH